VCCDRLRAHFGKNILENAVHGPSDRTSAENKIKLIFGEVEFDAEGLMSAVHFHHHHHLFRSRYNQTIQHDNEQDRQGYNALTAAL